MDRTEVYLKYEKDTSEEAVERMINKKRFLFLCQIIILIFLAMEGFDKQKV